MARKTENLKRQLDINAPDPTAGDLDYWLKKTPQERLAAVTLSVMQKLKPGERMDKTVFIRRKLK